MVQFSTAETDRATATVIDSLSPATPGHARTALARYVAALARFGAHTDLVGARTPETFAEIALADALVLARHPALVPSPVWEIGAGGASLLVPLALLYPEITGKMVEPRQKRATFLRLAVGHAGLAGRLTVDQSRVETATAPRSVAGTVLGRAVFAPEQWLPLADALARTGGTVVVLTTGPYSPPAGWTVTAREAYTLPVTAAARVATLLTRLGSVNARVR